MATKKKMLEAAAGGAGGAGLDITDVFSAYLYTGNGATQTVTNGVDLAGEGGLVWVKNRDRDIDHGLYDTERGENRNLKSNTLAAENYNTAIGQTFNSDGFGFNNNYTDSNYSGEDFASWTFRKAPKFFDVVTVTTSGSNTNLRISHSLGTTVGCIIAKRTDGAGDWVVWHNGLASATNSSLNLNLTASVTTRTNTWGTSAPTSTDFGIDTTYFGTSATYIFYIFAHNDGDGEFGPAGDQDIIKCGSFTTPAASADTFIDLGFEPQWLMVKSEANSPWRIVDVMRGMPTGSGTTQLFAEQNYSEATITATINFFDANPTGFTLKSSGHAYYGNNQAVIYMAIRRGPLAPPEAGTEVFEPVARTATSATYTYTGSNFPVDMVMQRQRVVSNTVDQANIFDRLRGVTKSLSTAQTQVEETNSGITDFSKQDGYVAGYGSWSAMNWTNGSTEVYWNWKRAPSFFDVVAYTGIGGAGQDNVFHNLGVAPELVIIKSRSQSGQWDTLSVHVNNWLDNGRLNASSDFGANGGSGYLRTAPTDTKLDIGSSINDSGQTYIAYLFATLAGVSKVGSYTGNGSSQTINAGFTAGARFILIKRTDSTGDWYVWDTARGIVAGNDPHLSLNTTAAEVTTNDSIDPDSSGFIVNQIAATNINVSSAAYIYYAIA